MDLLPAKELFRKACDMGGDKEFGRAKALGE
jgi:hypothetical protein